MLRCFFLAAVATLLSGCAAWNSVFDRERPVDIEEVRRLASCGVLGQGPEPKVHYLVDAAAIEAWAQERGVQGAELNPGVEGPFALVELGERGLEGYGVLVSREAVVHSDGRLVLRSTFFYAAQPRGRPAQASPCVLLALPAYRYSEIELYDQEGILRAHTSTKPESPKEPIR